MNCDDGCGCGKGLAWPLPTVLRPRRPPPPRCLLCGERVIAPCSTFLATKAIRPQPVPSWPALDPVRLPPDAFNHNIEEGPDRGRLPEKPPSLYGKSSLGWTL